MKRPKWVDRKTARLAEETFFERLGANVNALATLYNPLDNRTYDVTARNRVTKLLDGRSTQIKEGIKKWVDRDLLALYEEMPKNAVVLHEIHHKELLGPRTPKIMIAGAAFSPSEALIRNGSASIPASAAELCKAKDELCTQSNLFYYLGAFSSTGWEDAAKNVLIGSNFLIALIDQVEDAWRTYYAPDPRWRMGARVFDLTSDEEKLEAIRAFVKRHTLEILMDELTEEFVFDHLGYPIPIVREAFDVIQSEDQFVRFDTGSRPYRLIRVFS